MLVKELVLHYSMGIVYWFVESLEWMRNQGEGDTTSPQQYQNHNTCICNSQLVTIYNWFMTNYDKRRQLDMISDT